VTCSALAVRSITALIAATSWFDVRLQPLADGLDRQKRDPGRPQSVHDGLEVGRRSSPASAGSPVSRAIGLPASRAGRWLPRGRPPGPARRRVRAGNRASNLGRGVAVDTGVDQVVVGQPRASSATMSKLTLPWMVLAPTQSTRGRPGRGRGSAGAAARTVRSRGRRREGTPAAGSPPRRRPPIRSGRRAGRTGRSAAPPA
jgi:hypothetical protein